MKKAGTILYAVGWTQHTFERKSFVLRQFCNCCLAMWDAWVAA